MNNSTQKYNFEFKYDLWQWELFVKGQEHPNSESNDGEIFAALIAGLVYESKTDENVNL